ncbi:MAG: SOS response-associated peptidase [Alphaproteobacteria bacterium]|nr:SOS response-associated peptidase [Alphaproteobacteria bacterium]MCB9930821.1 SOS response-associated peptidase [Alphaproteobacteria bacterium]
MCNLYSNTMPVEAMRRLFGITAGPSALGNQPPLPAIFPRYEAPVLRPDRSGARELVRMHWGFLLPQTSQKTGKPIQPKAVTNARDDKVAASPFWRGSFEHRRCLIPATSFAEPKGRNPATYYWFGLVGADERPPFAFAGLWHTFHGHYHGEAVELDTYTIVTTTPNALVRPVHPTRMPVILDPDDYAPWLTGPGEAARTLLRPFPAERMRIVRTGVGVTEDPEEVDR